MQNINLKARKSDLPDNPPNSPVMSVASSDSFATAPSSPICTASQMDCLDIDDSSSLYYSSQDVNEQNRSPSPMLYLSDDDLFSPTIPPHMREPLSPITPPLRLVDEDCFPFPLTPSMYEHPDLDIYSHWDDPRELPRPSNSESIDDMATQSVDASPSRPLNMREQLSSLSQVPHPNEKRPFLFSPPPRMREHPQPSKSCSIGVNSTRSIDAGPSLLPNMREQLSSPSQVLHPNEEERFLLSPPPPMHEHPNLDTDPFLDNLINLPRRSKSHSIGVNATRPIDAGLSLSPLSLASPAKPYGQFSPGQGALHEPSSSQSPTKAGNTRTARLHPPAVDFRNSPDPVPQCACKFPNLEHRIGLGSSAPPAKCSKCGRKLGAIHRESAEKEGEKRDEESVK